MPTAVLSRQTAGLRGKCLILNLPGKPKAIRETIDEVPPLAGTLHALRAGPAAPEAQHRTQVFASIPYCIDLIGGPMLETDAAVVKAFRPGGK